MELGELIARHREEIIVRARSASAGRSTGPCRHAVTNGVPAFLTQLGAVLARRRSSHLRDEARMSLSAELHGRALLEAGLTLGDVVHEYGDACQAITGLAKDLHVGLSVDDFQTLNRCLDDVIADAVMAHARQRDATVASASLRERGFLAHELRGHLATATLAFHVIQGGSGGPGRNLTDILGRSLDGLRELVDRSVAEVRVGSIGPRRQRVFVTDLVEELEADASVEVATRGLRFSMECFDDGLAIDVDRHAFKAAVSNVLRNAFKFTRSGSGVLLRVSSTGEHVSIEVRDECGGLPAGSEESIFRSFERAGDDLSGLGLGLAISRQAVEADGGRITAHNRPGKGCTVRIAMPLAAETSIARRRPQSFLGGLALA